MDVAKKLSSSADIGDIDFGAGYGHSTVNVTGSIGYTIGSTFAITFTPTVGTNKVSNVSCTYTYAGKLENHGEF